MTTVPFIFSVSSLTLSLPPPFILYCSTPHQSKVNFLLYCDNSDDDDDCYDSDDNDVILMIILVIIVILIMVIIMIDLAYDIQENI